MTWFKVDDDLFDHPKVRAAGTAAMGLWVRCGSWSGRYLTEGWVPRDVALRYGTLRQAEKLAAVGLWVEGERDGERGWLFHQFLDRNPTRIKVENDRFAARERKQKSRTKHPPKKSEDAGHELASRRDSQRTSRVSHTGSHTHPVPVPVPKERKTDSPSDYLPGLAIEATEPNRLAEPASQAPASPRRVSYPDAFEAAWNTYGRKGAKRTAFAEWVRATQRTDPDTITAAIGPYVAATPDRTFRKDFERWLKGDCWESAAPTLRVVSGGYTPFRSPDAARYHEDWN